MYETYYRLSGDPFRLLPDPEICFPHRSCAKAWAYLRYALKRGEGIVVVTGPPGSGKTTLAERLLNELNPAKTVSVRLIANDLNPTDLLRKLAYAFGLPAEGMDRAMLAHRLERYLVELERSNRQALVLIDEAQTLSPQSLEAMRRLTDIQSRSSPVLQLFLLGQEGLEAVMASREMTQFQHRVIASCRLDRMNLAETKAYMEYRLAFADWQGDPSINGPAVMAIFRNSGGLPRHVNKICSRLFLYGCTEEKHSLKQRDVLAVLKDLRDELLAPGSDSPETPPEVVDKSFESVHGLALAPTPAAGATEKAGRHDELNTLFLADDPAPSADDAIAAGAQVRGGRGERWRSRDTRYSQRSRQHRSHRVGRWIHRLSRLPDLLADRYWCRVREWTVVIVAGSRRGAKIVAAGAARSIEQLRTAVASQEPLLKTLHRQLHSRPTGAAAGLAGLVVAAVVVMVWNTNADPQRPAVAQPTPVLPQELPAAEPAGQDAALDVPPPGSVDVAALSPGARETVGPRRPSATESGETDSHHDIQDERAQILLGRNSREVTDRLTWRAANASSMLRVGSLPNRENVVEKYAPGKGATTGQEKTGAEPVTMATGHEEEQPSAEADAYAELMVANESAFHSKDTARHLSIPADDTAGDSEAPAESPTIRSTDVTSGEPGLAYDYPGAARTGQPIPKVETAAPDPLADGIELPRDEIERLFALADAAMEKDWLTLPQEDNAYMHLQAVLAIDPDNREAYAGLDRIVRRYEQMAHRAIERKAYSTAGRYINRGLSITPLDLRMRALRTELESAIARKEEEGLAAAELARLAAEATPPEPAANPEKEPENSFYRLMRFVNGEN